MHALLLDLYHKVGCKAFIKLVFEKASRMHAKAHAQDQYIMRMLAQLDRDENKLIYNCLGGG